MISIVYLLISGMQEHSYSIEGGKWEASGTNMIRTALLSVIEQPERWIISSIFSPYKWPRYV